MTRRAFQHLVLVVLPLVYGAGFLAAAVRFLSPFPRGRRQERMDVGELSDYEPDARPKRVDFNGRRVFVLHDGDALRAFDAECTHLACGVAWNEEQGAFYCACHGAMFDRRGRPTCGPAVEPLREYWIADPSETEGKVTLLDRMRES
jgi:cytochrome b6-f complex iron-sulfur subunit